MSLRQLVTAFDNFFTKRAKYPNFKSKKNAKQSYLANLIIRSDGVIYKNHKFLQDRENKLIKLQRQLNKKQKAQTIEQRLN